MKKNGDFCLTNSLGFEDPPVPGTDSQLLHDYNQHNQR